MEKEKSVVVSLKWKKKTKKKPALVFDSQEPVKPVLSNEIVKAVEAPSQSVKETSECFGAIELPSEVWGTILECGIKFLEFTHRDIYLAGQICKDAYLATEENHIWVALYQQKYGSELSIKEDPKELYKNRTVKTLIDNCNEKIGAKREKIQELERVISAEEAVKYHSWLTYEIRNKKVAFLKESIICGEGAKSTLCRLKTDIKELYKKLKVLYQEEYKISRKVVKSTGTNEFDELEVREKIPEDLVIDASKAPNVVHELARTQLPNSFVKSEVHPGTSEFDELEVRKKIPEDLVIDANKTPNVVHELARTLLSNSFVKSEVHTGTSEFDELEVREKISEDLGMDANKAPDVHDLSRTRVSNSLIQAVSLLRQRDTSGVVSSLNYLLACDKAVPSSPLSWEVREELADLFSIYIKNDPTPEKLSRLQYLLSIEDPTVEALKEMKP